MESAVVVAADTSPDYYIYFTHGRDASIDLSAENGTPRADVSGGGGVISYFVNPPTHPIELPKNRTFHTSPELFEHERRINVGVSSTVSRENETKRRYYVYVSAQPVS